MDVDKQAERVETLTLFVNNEKPLYDAVVFAVKHLRGAIDRAAVACAKDRAAWHDDPEAEDHAEFHASAGEQFPRVVRDQTIRELVDFYLREMVLQDADCH